MTARTPFPRTLRFGSYEIPIEIDDSLPPDGWQIVPFEAVDKLIALNHQMKQFTSAYFKHNALPSFTRIAKGYMSVKSFRRGSISPVFWNVYGRKGDT